MPRTVARFAALAVCVVLAACNTAPVAKEASVPPITFDEYTLDNGLRVIASRDTSTPNVTVQVFYKVGSKDDPLGRSGFAHLFEHIMFKATENMPNETMDRFTEDVGGFNNATTYDDFTAYYEVVPAGHLERILWAEADRMSSLVVDEANFLSERDVVKEELRQNYLADPYGRLFGLALYQATYTTHPYKRPGIGSIEELDAATLDDIRAFHRAYYRPDNATLIVVGNYDEAQLREWVDKYYGDLENPDHEIDRVDEVEPARETSGQWDVFGPNVPLPALAMTWLATDAADEDAPALTVLDSILSGGRSSRLYNSLVYEQQIAVEAFSFADLPEHPGMFALGAIMSGGQDLDTGEEALLAEVRRLQEAPPTAAELDEAKNELVASALRERETIDDRAFSLGYALMTEGDAGAVNAQLAALQAVTAEDVQRVAQTYLDENLRMTLRYLPESERQPGQVDMTPPTPQVESVAYDGPVYELAAEEDREAPPPVGGSVSPVIPQASERTLANGLKVIVVNSSDLPLVTARLSIGAGAWADPEGLAGANSMTADMLTQGTASRSATDIASQTEALGAQLNAFGGADSATVQLNVMSDKLDDAMAIMADVTLNPAFAEEELERQRSQTLDNFAVAYTEPGSLVSFASSPVIYGGTPFGHVTGGTPNSIQSMTVTDLQAVHDTYYRPDNAILVLTGNISPAKGFSLAEGAFGDWSAPEEPLPTEPEITANAEPRAVVIDVPGQAQAAVALLAPAISRTDPDYYEGLVANAVLGTGYSSRLNQEIRIKRGLSYGAGSSLSARRTTGAFLASAQTKPESAAQVLDLMQAELMRLATEPVGAEEFLSRQSVLIGGFGRSLETTNGLAGLISGLLLYDIDLSELEAYVPAIEAVTPTDVQAFAAEVLDPTRASVVIAGDASVFGEEIRARAPGVEVVSADAVDFDSPELRAN